jgi:NitT/TauT family transport system permease protein
MPADVTAPPAGTAPERELDQTLAGLDALELGGSPGKRRLVSAWQATWPKLAALALGLVLWQAVVASGWKLADGTFVTAAGITMRRAAIGFAISLVIGVVLGSVVARVRLARVAFGSLITGIQTMPSIAWFPLAILLFKISEAAILFVVVLGAAPAIANGLISGADHIPPVLLRAGRVLGARGLSAYRHVILPASLPSFVTGLKQGWAFAWRSLMAGELLVVIADEPSIGFLLQTNRNLADAEGLLATMVVILVIGVVVDSLVFGRLDRAVRTRWGLVEGDR